MNFEKILITGGCGFVGANLAIRFKKDFPSATVVAFDNLRRRGSELNVERLSAAGVKFVRGDVRNPIDFDAVGDITILVEAAAEPSVLSGINDSPDYVIGTNLNGTVNCLNFALKHKAKFLFLSTSRVYPIRKLSEVKYDEADTRFTLSGKQDLHGVSGRGIAEDFPMDGARSFYGASKLSSELLIQEYAEFYGLQTVVNRCGVLTGPWQMGKTDQGVVALWIASHYWKKDLSYIGFGGKGKQVRDILHIDDLYDLIKLQLQDPKKYGGNVFNVGGGIKASVSLQELTRLAEEVTGNKINIASIKENRQADIPVYISDSTRIESLSGWKPKVTPQQTVKDIFDWIRKHENILLPHLTR